MTTRLTKMMMLGLAALPTWGCVGESSQEQAGELEIRPLTAQLVRAKSCDDLLTEIQADAVARVDRAAELLRTGEGGGYGFEATSANRATGQSVAPPIAMSAGSAGFANADGAEGAPAPAPGPNAPADPGSDNDNNSATAGPATQEVGGPDGYSDTNRQVSEVDEADIVKVDGDGRFVYLLHGDRLLVLSSWPAEDTAISQEVVLDRPLSGRPYEMFVKDGKVAIFSAVSGDARYALEPPTDPSEPRHASVEPECFGCDNSDRSFTKLTVMDLNGDTPKVERERYFEGAYVSSRRYDDRVRAVIRGGFKAPQLYAPHVEYTDPWGEPHPQSVIDDQVDAWRERTVGAILGTTLDHWLPSEFAQADAGVEEVERRCGDYYIPAPGLVAYGITNVVEFDLADADTPMGGAAILGDAAQVYSNTGTMVIAHGDYRFDERGEGKARTVLHAFDLASEGGIVYQASGFVDGQILNQFSMDERAGIVRVTTVEESWATGDFETDNRLRTLEAQDDELVVIGETPNLGKPRETIRSTRFVGDRAYVVTFEQTDPLVVVDLSDAKAPKVLGQVEIPGFSTYMHPLGEDHLLTIGEFIDPVTGGNRSLQLQIFDVSDPTMPRQAESYVFPLGGNSIASQQHKAFNYFADRKLLAFPYINWNTQQSTLEVFRVDTETGFERLGAIDHVGLFANCQDAPAEFGPIGRPVAVSPDGVVNHFYSCPGQGVRRGVFIDDYVMSVSYAGVLVHTIDSLATTSSEADAVARVDLQFPRYMDWEGNQWFGGGDFFGGRGDVAFGGVTMTPTPVATQPVAIPDSGALPPAPAEPAQGGGFDGDPVDPTDPAPAPDPEAGEGVDGEPPVDLGPDPASNLCAEACRPIVESCGANYEDCIAECERDFRNSVSCGEDGQWEEMMACCIETASYAAGCDASFDACQREACGELRPNGAAEGCF